MDAGDGFVGEQATIAIAISAINRSRRRIAADDNTSKRKPPRKPRRGLLLAASPSHGEASHRLAAYVPSHGLGMSKDIRAYSTIAS